MDRGAVSSPLAPTAVPALPQPVADLGMGQGRGAPPPCFGCAMEAQ